MINDDSDRPLGLHYGRLERWDDDRPLGVSFEDLAGYKDPNWKLEKSRPEQTKVSRYYDLSRFSNIWAELHNGATPRIGASFIKDNLDSYYEGGSRVYHGVFHIDQGLEEFDQVRHLSEHPEELTIAWYLHDAMYDTRKKDNEEQSAELARLMMSKSRVPEDKIQRVLRIIQITDHKTPPKNIDEKLAVDIDLSIFGQSKEKYDWYSEGIRKEYFWVPKEQFKQGRKLVLQTFLDRNRIYYTDYFKNKYESQARINLESEIKSLSV